MFVVFKKIQNFLVKIIEFRSANIQNFTLFTVCYAILNFFTRLFVLKHFSDNPNVLVLYWIFTVITIFSILSIFIFYIRTKHMGKVKQFLSIFVDVGRIEENKEKIALIQEIVEEQENVSFRYKDLQAFIFLPTFVIAIKFELFWLMWLAVICILVHYLYLRKLKKALQCVSIPRELFLKPSKPTLKIWENIYMFNDYFYGMLGIKQSNKTAAARAAEHLGKKVTPSSMFGFLTAVYTTSIGGYYFSENYYSGRGKVSPLMMWNSKKDWGFASDNLEILLLARSLHSRGCKMEHFCYPGSKILDPGAVQRANDYITYSRDNGKIIGVEVPLPTGPYLGTKEVSFNES